MRRNQTLLDALLELQALDRVPRAGYALRGVADPESVSEHAFHTSFLAWALAAEEPELDRARVVELALVHDLAEARTGDLPRTAARYFPAGAKAQAERSAARDLLAPLGERADALVAEYQGRETREARFVATCDKLQLLIKASAYTSWGAGALSGLLANVRAALDGTEFESVRRVVEELEGREEPS